MLLGGSQGLHRQRSSAFAPLRTTTWRVLRATRSGAQPARQGDIVAGGLAEMRVVAEVSSSSKLGTSLAARLAAPIRPCDTATKLLGMANRAGFERARCYGAHEGGPLDTGARLVIVATASCSSQARCSSGPPGRLRGVEAPQSQEGPDE
jgi:hypothetical protein